MPETKARRPVRLMALAWLTAAMSACTPGGLGPPRAGTAIGAPCTVTAARDALYVPAELAIRGPVPVSLVRRIDLRTGAISTFAGAAADGVAADGAPAGKASLGAVCGIAIDQAGNLLLSDSASATHGQAFGHNRIRVVAASSDQVHGMQVTAGDIYTLAGHLHRGFSGDGGPAVRALLSLPSGLAVDPAGNVIVADSGNSRIRVLAEKPGTYFGQQMRSGDIYTVAGSGDFGYSGDGGPGVRADLTIGSLGGGSQSSTPLTVDRSGNVLFADSYHGDGRIRLVADTTGTFYGRPMRAGYIYTIAGGGGRYLRYDGLGHGELSASAGLSTVRALALDSAGNLIVGTLYQVWVAAESTGAYFGLPMRAGHFYHVAGLPVDSNTRFPVKGGGGGDGAAASRAQFTTLRGVAVDSAGNIVVADDTRIRVIAANSGTCYGRSMTRGDIYTIAGVVER